MSRIKASEATVDLRVRDPLHGERATVISVESGPAESTVELGFMQDDGDRLVLALDIDSTIRTLEDAS